MTHTPNYTERFASLPPGDRRLLKSMATVALLALAIGIFAGLATGLVRGGLLSALPVTGYRFLTVHGVSIFFYWLFVTQAALLLGFAATEHDAGLAWPRLAWAGFLLMLLGLALSMSGSLTGTPLLY